MANEIKDLKNFIKAVRNEVDKNYKYNYFMIKGKSIFTVILGERINEIKNDEIIEKEYILKWCKV